MKYYINDDTTKPTILLHTII